MSENGTAGNSARREYERRKAKDEARLRADWGPLGGIAVALSGERQSTTAWSTGAAGEAKLGRQLDGVKSDSIRVLHDRRIPGTRANIDHIVVTDFGVWVIDAKKYKGRPELRSEGGILRFRVDTLIVGGRDQTKLVTSALKQKADVQAVVGRMPVSAVLCFVDSEWPLFGRHFLVSGVEILWPRRLVSCIVETHGSIDVDGTTALLMSRFPEG